jgi:hypothetical protein
MTSTSGEFEAAFQLTPDIWQRVIGTKFTAEACGDLATRFFSGDQSLLHRYELQKHVVTLTYVDLQRMLEVQERLLTRKSWQFWK